MLDRYRLHSTRVLTKIKSCDSHCAMRSFWFITFVVCRNTAQNTSTGCAWNTAIQYPSLHGDRANAARLHETRCYRSTNRVTDYCEIYGISHDTNFFTISSTGGGRDGASASTNESGPRAAADDNTSMSITREPRDFGCRRRRYFVPSANPPRSAE